MVLGDALFEAKIKQILTPRDAALNGVLKPLLGAYEPQHVLNVFLFYQVLLEICEFLDISDDTSTRQLLREVRPHLQRYPLVAYLASAELHDVLLEILASPMWGETSRYQIAAQLFIEHVQANPATDPIEWITKARSDPTGPAQWHYDVAWIVHARLYGGVHLARCYRHTGTWTRRTPIGLGWRPLERPVPGAVLIDMDRVLRGDPLNDPPSRLRAIFDGEHWIARPRSALDRGLRASTRRASTLWLPDDEGCMPHVLARIRQDRHDWRRTAMWLAALENGNLSLFEWDPMPDTARPLDAVTHAHAWETIGREVQPGDMLMVRDTRDRLSTVIARADDGAWSHCARPMGEGEIVEIDLPKIRRLPIDTHRHPAVRAALFRPAIRSAGKHSMSFTKDYEQGRLTRMIGGRYDLGGALAAGLESFLSSDPTRMTPNALVRSGTMRPIVIA